MCQTQTLSASLGSAAVSPRARLASVAPARRLCGGVTECYAFVECLCALVRPQQRACTNLAGPRRPGGTRCSVGLRFRTSTKGGTASAQLTRDLMTLLLLIDQQPSVPSGPVSPSSWAVSLDPST